MSNDVFKLKLITRICMHGNKSCIHCSYLRHLMQFFFFFLNNIVQKRNLKTNIQSCGCSFQWENIGKSEKSFENQKIQKSKKKLNWC